MSRETERRESRSQRPMKMRKPTTTTTTKTTTTTTQTHKDTSYVIQRKKNKKKKETKKEEEKIIEFLLAPSQVERSFGDCIQVGPVLSSRVVVDAAPTQRKQSLRGSQHIKQLKKQKLLKKQVARLTIAR